MSEEDRKPQPGRENESVASHNSGAESGQLIKAANKVSATDSGGSALTILKVDDWMMKKAKSLKKSLDLKTTKPPEGGLVV
ncbi:hypothetical protein [Pseudomonas putida]|uniref:hypothetical protein n=1 Tax=Pseudomonas putida TaxID=303 RepID=UPI0012FFC6C5